MLQTGPFYHKSRKFMFTTDKYLNHRIKLVENSIYLIGLMATSTKYRFEKTQKVLRILGRNKTLAKLFRFQVRLFVDPTFCS